MTHLAEVKSWILSCGPTSRVLQSPELVDMVKRELANASGAYS